MAPYVSEYDEKWSSWLNARRFGSWADWLQKHRIELNAMPPAQRIAWITGKIDRYPPRKVVPSSMVLHQARLNAARDTIHEELIKRARIEERTKEMVNELDWPKHDRLPKVVTRFLDRERQRRASWVKPMKIAGIRAANRAIEAAS